MHIMKEKEFINEPRTKAESRLIALRKSLIQADSLGAKHDIGIKIKALKEELVSSGRYKFFQGEVRYASIYWNILPRAKGANS